MNRPMMSRIQQLSCLLICGACLLPLLLNAQPSRITSAKMEFQQGAYEAAISEAKKGLEKPDALKPKDYAAAYAVLGKSYANLLQKLYDKKTPEPEQKRIRTAYPNLADNAGEALIKVKEYDAKNSYDAELAGFKSLVSRVLTIESRNLLTATPPNVKGCLAMLEKAENLASQSGEQDYDVFAMRGLAYLQLPDTTKAMADLEKTISMRNARLQKLDAIVKPSANDTAQRGYIKRDMLIPTIYDKLIDVYSRKGNSEKALKIAEDGKKDYPNGDGYEVINRAEMNAFLRDPSLFDRALNKFEGEIKAKPNDAEVKLVYANLLERKAGIQATGKKPEAAQTLQKAIDAYKSVLAQQPDNGTAAYSLGVIHNNMGSELKDKINAPNVPDAEYDRLLKQQKDLVKTALQYMEVAAKAEQFKKAETLGAMISMCKFLMLTDKTAEYEAKLNAIK
jgi:tetratricopeptide (TPR) repeat protein